MFSTDIYILDSGDVYFNNCVHVCQVIGRIKRGYLKCEPETNSAVYGAQGHHHNVFVSSGETPEDHCVQCK